MKWADPYIYHIFSNTVEEITFEHLSQKLVTKTTAEQLALPSLAVCFIFNS